MKPRLTVVLELRQAVETGAKRELGRLERERAGLHDQLGALHRRLVDASAAPVPMALREQLSTFRLAMRHAIAEQGARLAAHDHLIDGARVALAAAHREVKAIEAIRSRDVRTEAARQARREGRSNDEFAARVRLGALA